jgi:hypothetical protein
VLATVFMLLLSLWSSRIVCRDRGASNKRTVWSVAGNGATARLGVPLTTLICKIKRLGILSTVGPNLRRSSSSDLSAEWNFA